MQHLGIITLLIIHADTLKLNYQSKVCNKAEVKT